MPSIDITTAHKITITHDLAGFWHRVVSFLIDSAILAVYLLIWILLIALVFEDVLDMDPDVIIFVFVLPVVVFYSMAFEMFNQGRTPGKMILGLRVVSVDGRRTAPVDFFIRWAFRLVDIWFSLGTISLIMISSSDRNQRLGDLLANTTVVRTRIQNRYLLGMLGKMQQRENYTPVYPQVINLSEHEMVMIKSLLGRLELYRNEGHDRALELACEKMAARLSIGSEAFLVKDSEKLIMMKADRAKKIRFLQTLLKDYIILTR
jgi:uncharacterized RDD family membrane protein YckC